MSRKKFIIYQPHTTGARNLKSYLSYLIWREMFDKTIAIKIFNPSRDNVAIKTFLSQVDLDL